ncbi:hypothetical protein ACFY9G_22120 [Streptomyces anthocyanicus]|uniref:hypothetical protein n=1 Tax=Streptomyces anthocyanicus TaxID=68174 RepID=UPI0036F0BE89
MSLRALSAELKKQGRALGADALNKIENGRPLDPGEDERGRQIRRVDVDDLVALALALQVSPTAFLLPPTIAGDVQLARGKTVSALDAWMWVTSRRPLTIPEGDDGTAVADHQIYSLPVGLRRLGKPGEPGVQTTEGFVPMPDE